MDDPILEDVAEAQRKEVTGLQLGSVEPGMHTQILLCAA